MKFQDKQDCKRSIRRINELLSSGIFRPDNQADLLQQSAFIELMICLRDLMHKTDKYSERIAFTDDVLTNEYVKDVTDAITAIRDACCHIDSFKQSFDARGGRLSYMIVVGRGTLMKIGGVELKSDYDDDIAFYYGKNRLYFQRHIVRAFKEAQKLLAPHLGQTGS
jgi:hypothetical protein